MNDNITKRINYENNLMRFKPKTKDFGEKYHDGISYLDRGNVYLMCPHCFNLHKASIKVKVNAEILSTEVGDINIYSGYNVSMTCSKCKHYNDSIILDPNIAPAISIFNRKGYRTLFCCEGHGNKIPYVYFEDNFIMSVIHTLPLTWYLDIDDYQNMNVIIIRSFILDWREAVYDLILWAESIPEYCINIDYVQYNIYDQVLLDQINRN